MPKYKMLPVWSSQPTAVRPIFPYVLAFETEAESRSQATSAAIQQYLAANPASDHTSVDNNGLHWLADQKNGHSLTFMPVG